ncbi:MAG: acyltransferase family protein [Planctomycetota bacterium]|jgi:predicted acyltransferase
MNNITQQDSINKRIISIDALRGFDMFWIIGGGGIFRTFFKIFDNTITQIIQKQLRHAEWQGFSAWDLIMPLFLFVVGAVMPFSFKKRLAQDDNKKKLYLHVIKRTLILFVLGIVAQGHLLMYDLSKIHLYSNTLQAIAVGYLITSIIMLNFNVKWQVIITAGLLLLFWGLMTLVPVPGYGAGNLTPDGNLAIYLDKLVLRQLEDGTSYTWILSSITFACTVMLGGIGGQILSSAKTQRRKVLWLFGLGIGCLISGWIWDRWFPIIKHLWTSSFVLFSGGWCLLLLALFYLIIDVWGCQKWAFPFIVIGMNAILVYMATRLFDFRRIADVFISGLENRLGNWNDFTQAIFALVIIWLILYWMYRKKTFVKI